VTEVALHRDGRLNRTDFFAATLSLALDKSPSAARFTAVVPRAAAVVVVVPNALPAFSVGGIDVNIDAFDAPMVLMLVVAVREVRNDCIQSKFQVFFFSFFFFFFLFQFQTVIREKDECHFHQHCFHELNASSQRRNNSTTRTQIVCRRWQAVRLVFLERHTARSSVALEISNY
jgi:hypothetical protein